MKKRFMSDWTGKTWAFLTLRIWLAMRAIVTGIEKFTGTKIEEQPLLDEFGEPDISGAMVEVKTKVYGFEHYHAVDPSLAEALGKEPLLPDFFLTPYYAVLGYALIGLGLMLLVGLFTRTSLFLMGLLYTSLTFGLILIQQDGGVAWLGIHILMIALALSWADDNRLALTQKG
ncbi:DoxX family membrane protein [Kiritimatiella glycovorans]|uniref:DoxX n=1 Tax=Kiritimatiella glycovorans TaxID=1307763 RepID=A0A0G3ED48_9BACT|nr:DoxX family membrane protein [Kiritimatiella glycovorans]AKJ64396.1 hypothetical protein L21SP4_01146 [Kiritimatiella glycovorans]